MIDSSFNKYKADIFKTVKLTPAEERAYFEAYSKSKSRLIRDKIVTANARLVLKIALDYRNAGVALEDLISNGFCGLIRAVEMFDITRGTRFMTYALYWIKAAIHSAIAQNKNLISIPWNKTVAINKTKKSSTKIDDKLAIYDSINKSIVSFDSPAYDNAKNSLADVIKDKNNYDVAAKVESDLLVSNMLSCLPNDEKRVVCETYGVGCDKRYTLREIGKHMESSHSRIRQLRDQAIRRIKKYSSPKMLDVVYEHVIH